MADSASFDPIITTVKFLVKRGPGQVRYESADCALLTVADLGRERIHRRAVLGGLINEYSRAA
jgi:hypothetical protein